MVGAVLQVMGQSGIHADVPARGTVRGKTAQQLGNVAVLKHIWRKGATESERRGAGAAGRQKLWRSGNGPPGGNDLHHSLEPNSHGK